MVEVEYLIVEAMTVMRMTVTVTAMAVMRMTSILKINCWPLTHHHSLW